MLAMQAALRSARSSATAAKAVTALSSGVNRQSRHSISRLASSYVSPTPRHHPSARGSEQPHGKALHVLLPIGLLSADESCWIAGRGRITRTVALLSRVPRW
jgi:hypothetical protein